MSSRSEVNLLQTCGIPESRDSTCHIWMDKHLWFYSVIVAIIAIIAAILISIGVGTPAFSALIMPSWAPNPTIFIVIWSLMYVFITYAWFIADQRSEYFCISKTTVNMLMGLNLFLNILWVYFFFTAVNVSSSLFVIALLLILTLILTWYLYRMDKLSGYLFGVYSIWLIYILIWNFSIAT